MGLQKKKNFEGMFTHMAFVNTHSIIMGSEDTLQATIRFIMLLKVTSTVTTGMTGTRNVTK
jgi:hypothetical protein